jgi:hypothetical protein
VHAKFVVENGTGTTMAPRVLSASQEVVVVAVVCLDGTIAIVGSTRTSTPNAKEEARTWQLGRSWGKLPHHGTNGCNDRERDLNNVVSLVRRSLVNFVSFAMLSRARGAVQARRH